MKGSNSKDLQAIRCPRCGYDQQGVVATWTGQCPLEGTCSECGLTIQWAELHCPEKFVPMWCVEYAEGRWGTLRTAIKTYMRSFWPWRFWKRLDMSFPIKPKQLVKYVGFLLLLLAAMYVVEQSVVAVRVRYINELQMQQLLTYRNSLPARIQSYEQILQTTEWDEISKGKKERIERELAHYRKMLIKLKPSVHHSYTMAIVEAVFFPWASTSLGTQQTALGGSSYTPPRHLHLAVMNYTFVNRGWSRIDAPHETMVLALAYMVWGFISFLLLPIGFVLLPISRRRAKVRWGHITRITVYGLFIPVTFMLLIGAAFSVAMAYRPSCEIALEFMYYISLPMMIFVVIWWAVAIKRYLRMAHGWAVALLLGVIAVLIPLGVAVFLSL